MLHYEQSKAKVLPVLLVQNKTLQRFKCDCDYGRYFIISLWDFYNSGLMFMTELLVCDASWIKKKNTLFWNKRHTADTVSAVQLRG